MSATPLYCCALRTYSGRHPDDSVFVNTQRPRQRGDDWGADIKGDVCATRGYDRSKFRFITPFESDRENWGNLEGVNILDGQPFRMELSPSGNQDKVVPESSRIILRIYLRRPESKSLAPDGSPCTADTRGLLKRASITASEIIPVGKETDRRWEQGEDMSMLDFTVLEYRTTGNMVVADATLRTEISKRGVRALMRKTGLSHHTIEAIRSGKAVRRTTLKRMQAALRASPGQIPDPIPCRVAVYEPRQHS